MITNLVPATVQLTAFVRDGEDPTSFQVTLDIGLSDWATASEEDKALTVAELIFEATNIQSGPLWDKILPLMPEDRSHTSLSVGDNVIVGSMIAHCDPVGWTVEVLT